MTKYLTIEDKGYPIDTTSEHIPSDPGWDLNEALVRFGLRFLTQLGKKDKILAKREIVLHKIVTSILVANVVP